MRLKRLYGTLAVISFILLLCSAGGSDTESISFLNSVIQGGLSLVCCCVFAKLAVKGDSVDNGLNEKNDREAA